MTKEFLKSQLGSLIKLEHFFPNESIQIGEKPFEMIQIKSYGIQLRLEFYLSNKYVLKVVIQPHYNHKKVIKLEIFYKENCNWNFIAESSEIFKYSKEFIESTAIRILENKLNEKNVAKNTLIEGELVSIYATQSIKKVMANQYTNLVEIKIESSLIT